MIPTTHKGTLKHGRKTSEKEESLIISLQTQLALQTELCSHYEADLQARDELVEILGKKLATLEKDDTKRKNALHSWKKKVQELERVCRQLEETVEDSKQLIRAKAETDVEIKTSRDHIIVLKEEVERLSRHVHSLQQESADKEVKIVQMTKQHTLDKEDLQGLNIALVSKQQELELLKRKNGVKGTAGSTPAQPSKVQMPHITKNKRILLKWPHHRARFWLLESRIDGSIMGPLPLKSRPSIADTPASSSKRPSLSRSK